MSLQKFTWTADRVRNIENRFRTLETSFENGRKQYRSKGPRGRVFRLQFSKQNLIGNQPQEIIDFFNAHKGKTIPFKWDNKKPNGDIEELTVRFNHDSLPSEIFADTIYKFTLEFFEGDWGN